MDPFANSYSKYFNSLAANPFLAGQFTIRLWIGDSELNLHHVKKAAKESKMMERKNIFFIKNKCFGILLLLLVIFVDDFIVYLLYLGSVF